MIGRVSKALVSLLRVIAPLMVVGGLLLMLCLKSDRFKNFVFPVYPRYKLAHAGITTLEDFRYTVKEAEGKETKVGVLDIDHDSWEVMLDFLQSEIAFRKSERNEPSAIEFISPDESSEAFKKDTSKSSLPINWNRIKTILAVRVGVIKAGSKPLSAPYRLVVIWPPPTTRRVYEFLSFQEFRLDMNKMLVNELEYYAILASLAAFIAGLLLPVGRRLVVSLTGRSQAANNVEQPTTQSPNEALAADS